MPIRMAGQYFDSEVGISYNYFRDYDASKGRYDQSDPIGLNGGLNTYGYVGGSPLVYADPLGLRSLLPSETAFFQQYFGDCLNDLFSGFNLHVRQFGDTDRAFSFNDGFMSFPRSYYLNNNPDNPLNLADPSVASVAGHEALHQLQRKNGIGVTSIGLGLQLSYSLGLSDPYSYLSSSDPSTMLSTFQNGNPEQQGQMFQDYLRNQVSGQNTSSFQKIANNVKSNCGCGK